MPPQKAAGILALWRIGFENLVFIKCITPVNENLRPARIGRKLKCAVPKQEQKFSCKGATAGAHRGNCQIGKSELSLHPSAVVYV
jgi:hypothetical protein